MTYINTPDFKPGKLTTSDLRGLRDYQRKNDLKVDGIFGHQTKETMFFERRALRALLRDAETGARRARAAAGVLGIVAFLATVLHFAGA